MEVRLLGPLEVRDGDGVVTLPRRQQRALLAALALRAGEVVSTDQLVADLWGPRAPASATGSLQNTVSALRKLLGRDLLVTQAPGYRLALDADAVDANRFERLLAEARDADPAGASRLLAEALALWHGPALTGLEDQEFARLEARRLEELRVTAAEERVDAEVALGRHAALVGELETLVAQHPLRERLRGQLMLALYRCGRQAEALEVYRAARLALADELGLDPSPELQLLERKILRHDPSLLRVQPTGAGERPVAITVVAAAGNLRVVGRTREQAVVDAQLIAAAGGRSSTLLITGEPGIGKSTLLEYAAARAEGATILRARGVDVQAEFGFAGLTEILRPIVELRERLPDAQAGALVGALGLGPAVPADPFSASVATLSLLAAAAERGPVVVLVDDAHWLDMPSQQALLFAAGRLELERVALLIALRDDRPSVFDGAQLPTLRLSGLSEHEAARLLETTAIDLAPSAHRAVIDTAGGNPLLLLELPELLSAAQREGRAALPVPLPAGEAIESAYRHRLDSLSVEERFALLLAAAEETGDPDVVQLALRDVGLPEDTLEGVERQGALTLGARVQFRHPVLRSLSYQRASPAERRRAHDALARATAVRGLESRSTWHRALAATRADPELADALARMAVDSRSRGAFAAASAAHERAARLTPDRELRARRLVDSASDAQLSGQLDRADSLLEEAVELAVDPVVRAQVQELRARGLLFTGRAMEAHALLLDAASEIEAAHPDQAALLLAQAVPPCAMAGRIDQGVETGKRAVEVASRGSEPTQTMAELALAQVLILAGDAAGADRLRHRIRARPKLDDPRAVTEFLQVEAGFLMMLGEHDAARTTIEHLVALARGAAAPGLLPFPLATLAEIEFRTGRWLEAAVAASEAVELARQTGQIAYVAYALVIAARIHAARGYADESELALAEAAALGQALGVTALMLYLPAAAAFRALCVGDLEAAAAAAMEVESIGHERGLREPGAVLWPPDLIEALVGLGRTAEAQRALDRFQALAEATGRRWALATAARCRGLLAQDDGSEQHFAVALERHELLDMPFERARTELCLGERRARSGQGDGAEDPLRRALATFERLGAHPWAARATAELKRLGLTTEHVGPTVADVLTEPELRVALALASGRSGDEAAAGLFLSPRTVAAHGQAVYEKLGVHTPEELAQRLDGEDSEPPD